MKIQYIILTALLFVLLTNQSVADEATDTPLILGIHPFLSEKELIKRFTPLTSYLEKTIHRKIQIKVASNYQQHISFIGQDRVDIAYLGPSIYIDMVNSYGRKPILARLEVNGKPYFHGKIFTQKNSSIKTLADLKGKSIAFGDPNSTMSTRIPLWLLKQNGVEKSDLGYYQFLNNHSNVAYSVLMGDFDAGATKEAVYNQFESQGLRAIATTPAISEHLFVTSNKLDDETVQKLKQFMLGLNLYTEGPAILNAIKKNVTGLVSATDDDYNNLRDIMFNANRPKS